MNPCQCARCGRFFSPGPKAMWRTVYSGAIPEPDHDIYRCDSCVEKHGPLESDYRIKPGYSVGYLQGTP